MALYRALGVSSSVSNADLRKAYLHKAMAEHPDRNHGDVETAAKFAVISQAWSVLSDPDRRRRYDVLGDASLSHEVLMSHSGGPTSTRIGATEGALVSLMQLPHCPRPQQPKKQTNHRPAQHYPIATTFCAQKSYCMAKPERDMDNNLHSDNGDDHPCVFQFGRCGYPSTCFLKGLPGNWCARHCKQLAHFPNDNPCNGKCPWEHPSAVQFRRHIQMLKSTDSSVTASDKDLCFKRAVQFLEGRTNDKSAILNFRSWGMLQQVLQGADRTWVFTRLDRLAWGMGRCMPQSPTAETKHCVMPLVFRLCLLRYKPEVPNDVYNMVLQWISCSPESTHAIRALAAQMEEMVDFAAKHLNLQPCQKYALQRLVYYSSPLYMRYALHMTKEYMPWCQFPLHSPAQPSHRHKKNSKEFA